jgi:heptosyltransferase I
MIKSICIVRLSALGDVLMLVPLVRTLQSAFPEATITWVISKPAYYLVEGLSGVEFIVIKKPRSIADFYRFKGRMSGAHFDVLLATQASFRANLLYPLISATRKIGYDRLRAKDGHGWFIREAITPGCDHTLEGFLKFATALGVRAQKIQWDLNLTQEDRAFTQFILPVNRKLIVVVNPAASKPERSWLVGRYIAVIQYLQTVWNATVVLTGGPSDYDRQLGKKITAGVEVIDVIGQTKPKQLLALIQMADLMICPDTGPSHMAVAVGTPVVALHAVTSSAVSGPYTWRHWAVDFYPIAVEKFLKKTWPNQPWGMHAHSADAMALVSLEAVKARLDEVIPSLSHFTGPLLHK